MSGHSKWAQIKHKKAITDAKKGKLFSKALREIAVATKIGGANHDTNPRLKSGIERARSYGVPKDNIERAILRASGGGNDVALSEFLYEATLPQGLALLIEGITDNKNRPLAEIKHILSEYGGRLADPGSVLWNFEKVGTLEIVPSENKKEGEELALLAVEAGAKDFTLLDDALFVETVFLEREEVHRSLEIKGITVRESGHDYRSRNPIQIEKSAKEALDQTLETLLDQDDVQEIYTNILDYDNPRN